MKISPEIRAIAAPFATYRALALEHESAGWSVAFMRPALVALLIGTSTTICGTGRTTLGLALSGTLWWSFVPVGQLLVAAATIKSATRRTVSLARGIDLLFISHGPWSLWLLAMTAWSLVAGADGPPTATVLFTAIAAGAWTAVLVFAFCATVLETTIRGAVLRTVVHQALIWTAVLAYLLLATPLLQRSLAFFEP